MTINRVPNHAIYETVGPLFEEAAAVGRNIAIAVADEAGELVFASEMDGCHTRVLRGAIRKAYTAAVMQRSSAELRAQDRERGKELADWGDPMLTHLPGGAPLQIDGECYGAVGVGGTSDGGDDKMASRAAEHLTAATSTGQGKDVRRSAARLMT